MALEAMFQLMDPDNQTVSSRKSDKTSAVSYYSAADRQGYLKCQVLKCRFPVPAIKGGHIVPRKLFGSYDSDWHKQLCVSFTAVDHYDELASLVFPIPSSESTTQCGTCNMSDAHCN